MNITINNKIYEAKEGERLLDIARRNHAHIGFFCGGNAICQTCYVKVLEGSDLLSPLSDTEKALLSDNLIKEGTRMACLATVEKQGTLRVVSAVEEVKEMLENNPIQLVDYAGKMGMEALVKFPDTMRLQATRKFDPAQLVTDVIQGIGDAIAMVLKAFRLPVPALAECGCGTTSCGPLNPLHDGGGNGKTLQDSTGEKKNAPVTTSIAA
ncbi:MAG: (2Fe-2S)-binding protein [Chlorobiaceae bacterium]|nr:(2Fe-2S)-binding protein [Chlorobiaceae bacterium]NTV60336.1 (2Fe-2S)-binding protein [Chlorobiaceae bacterium]